MDLLHAINVHNSAAASAGNLSSQRSDELDVYRLQSLFFTVNLALHGVAEQRHQMILGCYLKEIKQASAFTFGTQTTVKRNRHAWWQPPWERTDGHQYRHQSGHACTAEK
jgi:hypothetical protein